MNHIPVGIPENSYGRRLEVVLQGNEFEDCFRIDKLASITKSLVLAFARRRILILLEEEWCFQFLRAPLAHDNG